MIVCIGVLYRNCHTQIKFEFEHPPFLSLHRQQASWKKFGMQVTLLEMENRYAVNGNNNNNNNTPPIKITVQHWSA